MHITELPTILKRDVMGRVSTTRERREALLDEFERSGLKGLPFARLVGVNYQTFASWVQKRRRARGDYGRTAPPGRPSPKAGVMPLRLVEAVLAPAQAAAAGKHEHEPLELLLPCGSKLAITNARQATLAAQFIQALRTPC